MSEAPEIPAEIKIPSEPARLMVRHKDMTPEQKAAYASERQKAFRARHPGRIRSYIDPVRYPLEPLPEAPRPPRIRIADLGIAPKPRKIRLASEEPYTEEEKAAHAEYMRVYRAKKRAEKLAERAAALANSIEQLNIGSTTTAPDSTPA